MTTQFSTLAYTKSPNTSRRRTTFQDELQAAVSARASKTETDQCSYSDDFDEDVDDFLKELLKSRREKKRAGAGKAAKGEPQIINDFDISDNEGQQPGRAKRVSFLKSQRNVSPSDGDTSESRENEPPGSSAGPHSNVEDSSSSQRSIDPRLARGSSSKSLSYHTSADSLLDGPLPLPSDNSVAETPGPEDKGNPVQEDNISHAPRVPADTDSEPPRPKPRQRTLGVSLRAADRPAEDVASPDHSRPRTPSTSIPLSSDASSNDALTEGSLVVSCGLSKSPSSQSEQSQLLTKTTIDSGSRDGFISGDSLEQGGKYSTSFEESNADSGGHSQPLSGVQKKLKPSDSRTSSSQTARRPHSVCSGKVESRYLGTLQLLDRKVPPQESRPRAANTIRAAVYQEWLQRKKEKSREKMQIKKKEEETLREKKKREEEAKKEDAVASYEAWKGKKAESLKKRSKEKQDTQKKVQRATEESEEKKHSAKQVFEKWKREHDQLLKEKARRQREAENQLRVRKQEKDEERKRSSRSAFSDWHEKKTVVLHEKVSTEREGTQNKAEEERYMKEEKDKMALEMYENWLVRKDLEQKRQKEERRIQAILQDSPPPWSPPNKTIPFRK
ncbi:microtubule-associated protein 9 [Clinocottus analis]|uniref:microtubule-associated protein 9 n=1 Tax=Clinocottus analis TaxID=304258 RepID=UPI0035C0667A